MSSRQKFFLSQWRYFIENRDVLTKQEIRVAALFFQSMKELSSEETKILAETYLKTDHACYTRQGDLVGYKPISDKIAAENLNMPIKEYKKRRVSIESKLWKIILKVSKDNPEQATEDDMSLLWHDGEYLKSYEKIDGVLQHEMTRDPEQAKIFNAWDNSFVDELAKKLGLQRIKPWIGLF